MSSRGRGSSAMRAMMGWMTGALVAAACSSDKTSAPPAPSALVLVGSASPTGQVGATVTGISVQVLDAGGNAMAGQPLAVEVAGGGSVAGAPSTTSAGATVVGTWTLGTTVGQNVLTIRSGSLTPVTVAVQTTAGPASNVNATSPRDAVNTVGAVHPVSLRVLDAFGNAVGGATVNLVASGGTLSASTATSNTSGEVTTSAWTLGTTRGPNALTASVGSASVEFHVVAEADVPADLVLASGDGQSASAGAALPAQPTFTVVDRFGNGVPGETVTFSVTGGGTLGAGAAVTDTNGVVTAPVWTLGKRNVPQRLTATAGALSEGVDAAVRSLKVTLRFFGTMTAAQKSVFSGAAERVSAMLTDGAGPVDATGFDVATACDVPGAAPLAEVIDGIVIYASIGPIDGDGHVLAHAGPCGLRGSGSGFLPAVASMLFDVEDLDLLAAGGSLEDVATHEMMHSLGFGTLWALQGLLIGSPTVDPRYVGTDGIGGCRDIGAAFTCASTVPVENIGGPGTAGGHWRESIFDNELMTGFLNPGANPMSQMSIRAMRDLGYQVSANAADLFTSPAALRTPGRSALPGNWERLRVPGAPQTLERSGSGRLLRMRSAQ